jgi:hypothetical protein
LRRLRFEASLSAGMLANHFAREYRLASYWLLTTCALALGVSICLAEHKQGSLSLPAFPTAQGGGAPSVGGRGGAVYEVTSLADSGAGTLRGCIQASGPRTCVFRVSGLITQKSALRVTNPYLTIAGQTAPGVMVIGGAGQSGQGLLISTHDVVVRYLTYDGTDPGRPCDHNSGTVGTELPSGDVYNVVLDHLSQRWWGNKTIEFLSNDGGNVHDVTAQWNLLYEPCSGHPVVTEPDTTTGSVLASVNQDWHHNMAINYNHRWPLLNIRSLRWVNNVGYNGIQNRRSFNFNFWGGLQADIIGNKYVDGPQSRNPVYDITGNGDPNNWLDPADCHPNCDNTGLPGLYLLNNLGHPNDETGANPIVATNVANDSGQISLTHQGWEGGQNWRLWLPTNAMPSTWFRNEPLPTQQFPIVADPVSNLDAVLLPIVGNSQGLDCSGKWISHRDAADARVIAQYQARGPGQLFHQQYAVPQIPSSPLCTESQHDGIPDQWKQANGLSTSDSTLYKQTAPNGYTYLENYLNGTNPN